MSCVLVRNYAHRKHHDAWGKYCLENHDSQGKSHSQRYIRALGSSRMVGNGHQQRRPRRTVVLRLSVGFVRSRCDWLSGHTPDAANIRTLITARRRGLPLADRSRGLCCKTFNQGQDDFRLSGGGWGGDHGVPVLSSNTFVNENHFVCDVLLFLLVRLQSVSYSSTIYQSGNYDSDHTLCLLFRKMQRPVQQLLLLEAPPSPLSS